MASTSTPMVSLRGVDKHFGGLYVLKDINLDVGRGEAVVILRPSGAGKSTLCRTINRLETIDSGTITIDGTPLPPAGRELARLRSEVGMVFQSFNLFADKTILENMTFAPTRPTSIPRSSPLANSSERPSRGRWRWTPR